MNASTDQLHRLETPTGRNLRDRSEASAQAIIDDIEGGLAKGALKAGDRLPDERSLCERYGAGRHTVRKALDLLVSQGVVARYVGRGSFIAALPDSVVSGRTPDQIRDWSLLELTEARLLLEPGIAALVLERANSNDFKHLQSCIDAIEHARDWREFKERKYAFHRALALATRNSFITHIFDLIIATRRNAWEGNYYRIQDMVDARAACLGECRAILGALLAGNEDGATDAIRRSITRIMVMVSAL
jgi:DNA-binding FadR family transcriptional regulator